MMSSRKAVVLLNVVLEFVKNNIGHWWAVFLQAFRYSPRGAALQLWHYYSLEEFLFY